MAAANRILIIDDEETSCRALSLLLKNEGYQVESTRSGEEALKLLDQQVFDLIISDLFLPGINGIEVLKKTRETTPHSCFIMITGNASAETAVEAMKEGGKGPGKEPADGGEPLSAPAAARQIQV